MKLKLDENIGRRGLEFLRASGHDVLTSARLSSVHSLASITISGRSCFPPEESAGIIILEHGPRATVQAILDRLRDLLVILQTHSVSGALWIVVPGRVRIHLKDREE